MWNWKPSVSQSIATSGLSFGNQSLACFHSPCLWQCVLYKSLTPALFCIFFPFCTSWVLWLDLNVSFKCWKPCVLGIVTRVLKTTYFCKNKHVKSLALIVILNVANIASVSWSRFKGLWCSTSEEWVWLKNLWKKHAFPFTNGRLWNIWSILSTFKTF